MQPETVAAILDHSAVGAPSESLKAWLEQNADQVAFAVRVAHIHLSSRSANPRTYALNARSAAPRVPGPTPDADASAALQTSANSTAQALEENDTLLPAHEVLVRANIAARILLAPTGLYPLALPEGPDQRTLWPNEVGEEP